MKKKNISGFGSIYYKGKKLNFTGPVTTGIGYFEHIYTFGLMDMRRQKHMCLRSGYWCWSNLFENPTDIFSYIKSKISKSLLSKISKKTG